MSRSKFIFLTHPAGISILIIPICNPTRRDSSCSFYHKSIGMISYLRCSSLIMY